MLKLLLTLYFVLQVSAQNEECGQLMYSQPSGSLESPGFPNNYPNDLNCEYTITTSPGQVLVVSFQLLDVEFEANCAFDSVEIFDDGNSVYGSGVCGDTIPNSFTSMTSNITITFQTDSAVTESGFQLSWTSVAPCTNDQFLCPSSGDCIDSGLMCNNVTDCPENSDEVNCEIASCGETFMNSTGLFSSPFFDNFYPNNLDCTWIILSAPDQVIEISVDVLSIENTPTCELDYLEILDDGELVFSRRLCGSIAPTPFRANSTNVTFVFHTNERIGETGFSVTWEIKPKCAGNESACFNGTCIPRHLLCDGTEDCEDGRDEVECSHMPSYQAECGKNEIAPSFSIVPRIIGGSRVTRYSWPWQAALIDSIIDSPYCGGSIISSRYILTAAHCVLTSNPSYIDVVVGRTDITDVQTGQRLTLESITIHENYNFSVNNDIALIRTNEEINFEPISVAPICLGEEDVPAGTNCYITGWGNLSPDDQYLFPNILQQAFLPIVSHSDCSDFYHDILPTHICAGRSQGGVDTCQGDFGGPLVCLINGSTWFQMGISSFGFGCAKPDTPGVYTRVSAFVGWINNIVDPQAPIPDSSNTLTTAPPSTVIETTTPAPIGCGELEFTGSTGIISSPGYPEFYPNYTTCNYTINVDTIEGINITFSSFDIEYHSSCSFDYVEIFENEDSLGRYCGNDLPSPIMTTSSNVTIVFYSDLSENRMGFSLSWAAVANNPCDSNPCHSSADCSNYDGSPVCTCQTGYTGNGYNCVVVNPCLLNPCHQFANCIPTQSSYFCRCREGYTGDGQTSCTAIATTCGCTGQYLEELQVWRNAFQDYQVALREWKDGQQDPPCYNDGG